MNLISIWAYLSVIIFSLITYILFTTSTTKNQTLVAVSMFFVSSLGFFLILLHEITGL